MNHLVICLNLFAAGVGLGQLTNGNWMGLILLVVGGTGATTLIQKMFKNPTDF